MVEEDQDDNISAIKTKVIEEIENNPQFRTEVQQLLDNRKINNPSKNLSDLDLSDPAETDKAVAYGFFGANSEGFVEFKNNVESTDEPPPPLQTRTQKRVRRIQLHQRHTSL